MDLRSAWFCIAVIPEIALDLQLNGGKIARGQEKSAQRRDMAVGSTAVFLEFSGTPGRVTPSYGGFSSSDFSIQFCTKDQ